MLAMPGLRAFSLARKRAAEGVPRDADGVLVGGVPLLQTPADKRKMHLAASLSFQSQGEARGI